MKEKKIKKHTKENKKSVEKLKDMEMAETSGIPEDAAYEARLARVKALFEDPRYQPMRFRDLCFLLEVSEEDRPVLSKILDTLEHDGVIEKTPRGKYMRPGDHLRVGTFCGSKGGFGFVTVEGEEEDYFIPAKYTGTAVHTDKVQIRVRYGFSGGYGKGFRGHRREAEVIKILSRGFTEIVGTYEPSKNYGFVVPDQAKIGVDIYIPKGKSMGAVAGVKCVARITDYGTADKSPTGEVTEILGDASDPKTDIIAICRGYEIPTEYPEEVLAQAETMPKQISSMDLAGRKDLRGLTTVTIDGADAKDLDDAITLEVTETGYRLGVHIADVSHYVTEGSPLDKEALRRGTSVYFPNKVVPMLPENLSNGICSLNAGEDRLTMSCIMEMDSTGKIVTHEICESVICVNKRMSYEVVNAFLEGEDDSYKEYETMIRNMTVLSDLMRTRRKNRGSIDFDFAESEIVMTEDNSAVADVRARKRGRAQLMIEDFMLAANETVAEDYYWQEMPFLYRVHELPDPVKIDRLKTMIAGCGYRFRVGKQVHPKEIQQLLEGVKGTVEEAMIHRMVLQAMMQAKYATTCDGHFGLATAYYTHFTSPIRRYPDLQIHRIIKENLRGGVGMQRQVHYNAILPGVAEKTSKTERIAEEAEREIVKARKAQYMAGKLGECYPGVISGLCNAGIFVELPNTVEGLVSVRNLTDDSYFYNEETYVIIGKVSGKEYHLGQCVYVRVIAVDLLAKTVDFEFITQQEYEENTADGA